MKIKNPHRTYLWQQIPSPTVSEILAKSSVSGVVLDTEHGVFNDETLFTCIQIITLSGKQCLVRLTEAGLTRTRYCLDAGVDGLIFSTVEGESYCRRILDQCRFPTISIGNFNQHYLNSGGRRGFGLTRDNFWGSAPRKEDPILIAQIETKEGCDFAIEVMSGALTSSLEVFDYFLVGPYDLSSSMGCPGDFNNSYYKQYVAKLEEAVGADRIGYHIVKDIEKQIDRYKDYGFLAFSLDTIMLLEGSQRIIETLK